MSETYNETAERLWEKIEFHRNELDLKAVNLNRMFLFDQLAEKSPLVKTLLDEVEEEFKYSMSEHQASWAIWQAKIGDMEDYNKDNKLSLKTRK